MNIIVDLCSNTAASYISQGKLVEAIPNLRAAMHFGGNESARINSIYVSETFADRAQEALARGDAEDAARNAGLSLTTHKNERALITLAQLYLGSDPVAVDDIARQLVEIASDDDPRGLKINALIWRLDALQKIEPRDADLEEQIGRDAVTAISRHLELHGQNPSVLMTRAMLYRRFGNLPAALADLRAMQKLDPSNFVVAAHCVDMISNIRNPECMADLAIVAYQPGEDPQMLSQFYDLARRTGAATITQGLLDRMARIDPAFKFLADAKWAMRDQVPAVKLGATKPDAAHCRAFVYAHDAQMARTLLDVTLPMLLAPGNLPAVAASRAMTLDIMAPLASLAMMEASPILAKLAEVCAVELRTHAPAPAGSERRAYGLAFEAATLRATAEDASLIALPTNALIADGSLATLIETAQSDRTVLLFDPLEVASAPLFGWLGRTGAGGERIVMRPSELSEAVLRHMPSANRRWIVDDAGKIESGARRMLFAKPNGLSAHSLQAAPLFIGARALVELGEELSDPPDGFIIDRVLSAPNLTFSVLADTKTFAIAILADLPGSDLRTNPRNAIDVVIEQCRTAPSTLGRTKLLSMATHWSGLPPVRMAATTDDDEAAIAKAIADRVVGL